MVSSFRYPQVDELVPKPKEFSEFLNNDTLVMLHERDTSQSNQTPLVTGFVSLNRSLKAIKNLLLNFDVHENIIKHVNKSRLLETANDEWIVKYELVLEMGIISPSINFTVKYELLDERAVQWELVEGDLKRDRGRWVIHPIQNEKSLLMFTNQINFENLGWTLDAVLWAQPDLKDVLPCLKVGTYLDAFKRELGKISYPKKTIKYDNLSKSVPVLTDKPNFNQSVRPFTENGLPMIIHEPLEVLTENENQELIYTSAIGSAQASSNISRNIMTDFRAYPEFIDQIRSADVTETRDGYQVEWKFNLGFSFIWIPVGFLIEYNQRSDTFMTFELKKGDFSDIHGAMEWAEAGPNETTYIFSSASFIGENAPRLIQLANKVKDRQIIMGLTLGCVLMENSINRIEKFSSS